MNTLQAPLVCVSAIAIAKWNFPIVDLVRRNANWKYYSSNWNNCVHTVLEWNSRQSVSYHTHALPFYSKQRWRRRVLLAEQPIHSCGRSVCVVFAVVCMLLLWLLLAAGKQQTRCQPPLSSVWYFAVRVVSNSCCAVWRWGNQQPSLSQLEKDTNHNARVTRTKWDELQFEKYI